MNLTRGTSRSLEPSKEEPEPAPIRVGTAGWLYEDWKGVVYPTRAPRGFDRLAFHAGLFDTNEINSTFYRIPEPRQTADWGRRVAHNPRFAFAAKLYRGFTHERSAGGAEEKAFTEAMRPLAEEERLGVILVQFPFSFRNTAEHRAHLTEVLGRFGRFPLAVEFRHESWNGKEVLQSLEEHGVAFVNIDQPRLSGNLPETNHTTSEIAYYRFHGRNAPKWFGPDTSNEERYNYLYSSEELEPWAARIEEVRRRRPRTSVFAILNNHFRGQAVANAVTLQHRLTGAGPDVPPALIHSYPALARIVAARPEDAQRRLFPE